METLECSKCKLHFNTTTRKPLILQCGHNCCLKCIQKFNQEESNDQLCTCIQQESEIYQQTAPNQQEQIKKEFNESIQEQISVLVNSQDQDQEIEGSSIFSHNQNNETQDSQIQQINSSNPQPRVNLSVQNLRVSQNILDLLNQNRQPKIFCTIHNHYYVQYYCSSDESLICEKCLFEHYKQHHLILEIDEDFIINYTKKLVTITQEFIEELDLQKKQLEQFLNDEIRMEGAMFNKIVTKLAEMNLKGQQIQQVVDPIKSPIMRKVYPIESNIINNIEDQNFSFLQIKLKKKIKMFKHLYTKGENNKNISMFDVSCCNKGPVIALVKTNFNNVYGIYLSESIPTLHLNNFYDSEGFLFSYTNQTVFKQLKSMNHLFKPDNQSYSSLPLFYHGGPNDDIFLSIRNIKPLNQEFINVHQKNNNNEFNAKGLRRILSMPEEIQANEDDDAFARFIGGGKDFKNTEFEVHQIVFE
eukprot:403346081